MSEAPDICSEGTDLPNDSSVIVGVCPEVPEDKDLIKTILGEMKSEFNREPSLKPEKMVEPEVEEVPKKTAVKPDDVVDSNKKFRSRSVDAAGTTLLLPKVEENVETEEAPKRLPQEESVESDTLEAKSMSPVVIQETKPRIVLTLKAADESSEGYKKQKSKSQVGSEEVWTVKVESNSNMSSSTHGLGKRSLRSRTVVKSSPEPEGVKRSARRRSKDLPRESVLQSAIARKEKSFSLYQNDEKQVRTPRHRSPLSPVEKSVKSVEAKKSASKAVKAEISPVKPVKPDNNIVSIKIKLDNSTSAPKLSNSESSIKVKLDVVPPKLAHEVSNNSHAATIKEKEKLKVIPLSSKSLVRGRPKVEMGRSRNDLPLSSPRVMLAMKSAPSNPPNMLYTKTGKRRHKPFRGLRYSLTSGAASRRANKTSSRSSQGESPVDPIMKNHIADLPVSTSDRALGNGSALPDEASQISCALKRKSSADILDYTAGDYKRGRQDNTPSPSPGDSCSNLPAKPESTAISRGAGTAGLCLCQARSQLFVSTVVGASDIYCQAVDTLDDRLVGCCNSIEGAEVRMLRPSRKVPFMILCNVHTERLIRHNCCPTCGTFCTQGKFVQCPSNHFYHRDCQLVGDVCPHCGVKSPEDDSTLLFKSHRNPVFVPQQNSSKKLPSAKMGFVGCTASSQGQDLPLTQLNEPLLRLPSGRQVSCNGLPPSLDKEKLESLLNIAKSIPMNLVVRYSIKSLYKASKSGNTERLINVLASGLNPNHPFREGLTSLHLAALSANISSVHILVQAGAELDVMDKQQFTALMLATLNSNNAVVKYLVKAGASVTLKGSDGKTALHIAAMSGNLEACHYLLSVANVGRSYINSEDDGGWTPLVWAAEHCHVLVAKFLLDRRADPFVRDSEQNIALHWSAFSGCVDISELLLNYGSEVNCVNVHGDTPLHIGARQNMYHCVLLLLMRGAKVDLINVARDSPLECCQVNPSDCYTVINLNKQLQAITNHPARRLLTNDISRGKEINPVQCVNNEDKDGEPTDYVYVSENCYTSNIVVDRTITSLQSCKCVRDTCTSAGCNCGNVSLQCWYDPQGRLLPEFNFADPPMIFECNQGCACNRVTCHNRVVQHGLTCRFQLFRTREKGWGLRTLRHIQKGSYVCEYIGEIISDCEADHREDDSYLFDLDNRDGETYCIDARHYGNVARFINHMCVPNLMPVRVFIDHQDLHFPRIAFFANQDIQADEELGLVRPRRMKYKDRLVNKVALC